MHYFDLKAKGKRLDMTKGVQEAYQEGKLDIYNFLLRKNGYKTEEYSYLLFYHPSKINANGDVIFYTDLIEIEISTKNAEAIFKEALTILKAGIPISSQECGFCKWVPLCR